jgi:hypothetical protein
VAVAAGTFLTAAGLAAPALPAHAAGTTIAEAAAAAQQRFGVPASLLEAICYFEGQLSDHGGAPSSDGGYGCVDLARNSHLDTLDQAAQLLVGHRHRGMDRRPAGRGSAGLRHRRHAVR